MNSNIQKFDIGFSLEEKLMELTGRGMNSDAALSLIMEGVSEWVESKAEPVCGGSVWTIDETYRIRPCNRRDVPAGQQWFESWADAAICLASMARSR